VKSRIEIKRGKKRGRGGVGILRELQKTGGRVRRVKKISIERENQLPTS